MRYVPWGRTPSLWGEEAGHPSRFAGSFEAVPRVFQGMSAPSSCPASSSPAPSPRRGWRFASCLRSEPYVELTRQMMRRFGVDVTADDGLYKMSSGQRYRATDTDVPGDFSSAAFPLVASAITDGDVTVTGLDVDGPLGDRKIVDILRRFGASVEASGDRVRVRGGPLVAQTVDIGDTPDLFPILAVLASQAQGETRFVNGRHLRFKESDRIEATVSMLLGLGGRAKPTDDGCIVVGPTRLLGGSVDARGDHRILMAAAVAGPVARAIVDVSDPWSFRVSYPSFLEDFQNLGALHAVVA